MEFLRKHWEKVLMLLALLGLIAAGAVLYLKIDKLREGVAGLRGRTHADATITPLPTDALTNSISRLNKPATWQEFPIDPFSPTPYVNITTTNTATNPLPPPKDIIVITLLEIRRVRFTMNLYAYAGNGRDFQINLKSRNRTYIIKNIGDLIKDQFGDTGWVVTKFEKKFQEVPAPELGGTRKVDVSELTVEHKGDKPIILVLGKDSYYGEPVAKLQCDAGRNKVTISEVKIGQNFGCGPYIYNVVDISEREMLFVDTRKPEEKHTLGIGQTFTVTPGEEEAIGLPGETEQEK